MPESGEGSNVGKRCRIRENTHFISDFDVFAFSLSLLGMGMEKSNDEDHVFY